MPYDVHWEVPDHILVVRGYNDISADDLTEASHKMVEIFATTTSHKIHLISDSREITSYPKNLKVLSDNLKTMRNDKIGLIVSISENDRLISFFSNVVSKVVLNKNTLTVDSLEEAIASIQAHDPTA